jgi:hypothetical protein
MPVRKIIAVFLLVIAGVAKAQTFQSVETKGLPSQRHEWLERVFSERT